MMATAIITHDARNKAALSIMEMPRLLVVFSINDNE